MPFLTIAATTIEVQHSGATQVEGFRVGQATRAWDGTLRVTRRTALKREWHFTTKPMLRADALTLRSLIDNGQFQNCSGDALDNPVGGIMCLVTVTEEPYIPDGLGFQRVLQLTVAER